MCVGANPRGTNRLLVLEGISEIPESHLGHIDPENEQWSGEITFLKITQLVGSKVHNRALILDTLATSGQGAKLEPFGKFYIL